MFTCYFSGYPGGDGWTKALVGGGFQGEEVRRSRVEANEQMMGLVLQLEHSSSLGGQISAGVQGAQSLVGYLEQKF